jgi:ATPase subunit of ABC transporter with duplicated ATPase domains
LKQVGFDLVPSAKINGRMRIEYLDQHYGLIDKEKSILDNVLDFSSVDRERAHQHLSHFLFDDSVLLNKKAKMLSGGMLARLAFVMLTIFPIDLLILDEPTNNLDQETISEIVAILNEYKGALLVISHDIGFLRGDWCHKGLGDGKNVQNT